MNSSSPRSEELQSVLENYPYHSIIVPCPCTSGSPFPAQPDCLFCNGTGKIMYGLAEVEVR